MLASPDFTCPFILQTDASDCGVDAVLSQCDDGKLEHPVAYFSQKLLPQWKHYSTIKECLANKLFQGVPQLKTTYDSDRSLCLRMVELAERQQPLINMLEFQPYQFCNADMSPHFTLLVHLLLGCLSPSVYLVVLFTR